METAFIVYSPAAETAGRDKEWPFSNLSQWRLWHRPQCETILFRRLYDTCKCVGDLTSWNHRFPV